MTTWGVRRPGPAGTGRWACGLAVLASLLVSAGNAAADESVREFMQRYEMALDRGDPAELSRVYEDWTPTKASALERYFTAAVTEFNVEFSELEINDRAPASASIRFLRRDRFTDAETGRRVERRIRLKRTLRRHGRYWKLARLH